MSKSPTTQTVGPTSKPSEASKTPKKTIDIPEIGAALLLLARNWRKQNIRFPSQYLFSEIPVLDSRWHVSEIEGGVRVTVDHHVGASESGLTDKGRIESELAKYSRHKKNLALQIHQRQGHIAAKTQEIAQVQQMLDMPANSDDDNLPRKLAQFKDELAQMENAVAYWQNELAPIDTEVSAMEAALESAKVRMGMRITETWDVLDSEEIEVRILVN